jgi:hypothetical protein
VRIGIRQAKELDLDVEDSQAVLDAYEKAVADGERMLWVTEKDGRRFGAVVELIAYIEVEAEGPKRVGFSQE